MKKLLMLTALCGLLASCGQSDLAGSQAGQNQEALKLTQGSTKLPAGLYRAKKGDTFKATNEGTPEYNKARLDSKTTGKLNAQALNITYTKVATYGQSYTVPAGQYNIALKNIYTVGSDNHPETDSYSVTPGTVNVCGETPYGLRLRGNEQYACYTYSVAERPYSADKIEMFNRWDWKYFYRIEEVYRKLQITDLGYSRGDYNTEWRLWHVGYFPNGSEIQQARSYFQGRGWDLTQFVGKEKTLYALYVIYTAPDDYGTPPAGFGWGLKANLWDEAGRYNSITVR